ncbi:hypothetical protein ACXEO8_26180 [Cytobacillus firmus]|nr:hypothetical protein [Cytobacillus firmus]WHY64418.1 hypothetical protein QNH42_25165 [Cytobacillus firmus]
MLKKNSKWIAVFLFLILLIAGLLDLKYQGLFYQLLPESIQSKLTGV